MDCVSFFISTVRLSFELPVSAEMMNCAECYLVKVKPLASAEMDWGDWWSWERSFTSHSAHRHLPNLSWNSWCWIIFSSSGAFSLSPPPARWWPVRCGVIEFLFRLYLCFFLPLNRLRACWLLSWIQQRISEITCLREAKGRINNYEELGRNGIISPGGAYRSIVRKIIAELVSWLAAACCLIKRISATARSERALSCPTVPHLLPDDVPSIGAS